MEGDGQAVWEGEDGGELRKVNSRGGLWHDEVSPLWLSELFDVCISLP